MQSQELDAGAPRLAIQKVTTDPASAFDANAGAGLDADQMPERSFWALSNTGEGRMPRRWSIRFVGLFALLEGSQLAHAQQQYQFNQGDLVEVGNHRSEFWSEGGCDNDKEMRVAAANDVYVPSQRSTMAPMLTPTTKIYWYCNGERRTINRERPFTWFKADRAGDGTIQWTFYSGRSG